MKRLIFASFLLVCAGCADPTRYNLVVVGNSITQHVPDSSIGWSGNWGMAVKAEKDDFAHVAANLLMQPVTAVNAADLERTPITSTGAAIGRVQPLINRKTTVVVELGDNALYTPDSQFAVGYDRLLSSMDNALQIACVSTFWHNSAKDVIIAAQCAKHGGVYVFIGDVRTDPLNTDWKTIVYTNEAVQGHPHEWSMNQIGQRVSYAVQTHLARERQ